MTEESSTTRGLIRSSLCVVSAGAELLLVCEVRDTPRGETHRASTSVWIHVDLPLPGGPATMIPGIPESWLSWGEMTLDEDESLMKDPCF